MFWDTFTELCKERGKKPNPVAAELGISSASVTKWKTGSIPRGNTLKKIADYFGVSIEYLFSGTEESRINIFDIPGIEPMPRTKKIPLLGEIACGDPILAEENFEGYIKLEDGIDADLALRCRGDSMINARILDGDIVYIRQQPTVENGQIAAVLIDGEATLKRVYIKGDTIILQPENPAYEPMIYTKGSGTEIRILGRAVAFTSVVL